MVASADLMTCSAWAVPMNTVTASVEIVIRCFFTLKVSGVDGQNKCPPKKFKCEFLCATLFTCKLLVLSR